MNSLKRKNNLFALKRDYENLIELSFKKREEGDYVGALSILWGLQRTDNNPDIYAHIADIYADMDLNETAVNYWYKFLRYSKEKYYCDAYNGLGANFFLAGNLAVAGYYFNKQLELGSGEDCVYEDVLEDYFDALTDARKSAYKVVYPPSKEEEDEKKYNEGKSLLDNNEYERAIEKFEEIKKGGKYFLKAKVEKAYALFYLQRVDEAFKEVKDAIAKGEKNIYSISLAINAVALVGTQGQLGKFLDMLIDYEGESDEEKYNKLNLLVGLSLVDEALEYSKEVLKIFKYQHSVYELRGAMLYNLKDYKEAEEAFRYSNILMKNPIAEYYRSLSESALRGAVILEKIDKPFELPEDEGLRRLGLIKNLFDEYTAGKTVVFPKEMKSIAEWVYVENNQTLQIALAILIAYSKDFDCLEVLKNSLITTIISDEVKHRIVSVLCEHGVSGEIAVVFGYVYRKIKIPVCDFSGEGEKTISRAHAYAFGRLSVIEDKLSKLKTSAEKLQKELEGSGKCEAIKDLPALACLIYLRSGMNIFDDDKMAYKFFSTERKSVKKIIELIEKRG